MVGLVKSTRPVNLLIVLLTQCILYFLFFRNLPLDFPYIQPKLKSFHFFLLFIVTLLIAGNGYLINDYFDFEADKGKANKIQAPSPVDYLKLYFVFYITGLVISFYLAHYVSRPMWLVLYIIATGGLILYSASLKSRGLVGNLLVAAYTASVILIIPLAEYQMLDKLRSQNIYLFRTLIYAFAFFSLMAFLINLIRELIKDLEDKQLDKAVGSKSFAVTRGLSTVKRLLIFIWLLLLITVSLWMAYALIPFTIIDALNSGILLLMPMFILFYLISEARQQADFKRISLTCKLMMPAALLHLIIYKCI